MAQASRVTSIDPSKRENAAIQPSREYHHPLEGLSHPIVIGTLLAMAEVMAFLGMFFGLRLSLAGFYIISMILLSTRIWSETRNTHPLLDGEYAWIVRLLVVVIGCVFVEVGMTMKLSWQSYAAQAFGFSIPITYTTVLLHFRSRTIAS